MPVAAPVMTLADLGGFLRDQFSQVADDFRIAALTPEGLRLELVPRDIHLRPGGTVSGPTLFALADVAAYLAILSRIGPVPLAVTTNAGIDFLRKPAAGQALTCEARLLKLGRTLAIADALIWSAGQPDPVARANLTYAIPPKVGVS